MVAVGSISVVTGAVVVALSEVVSRGCCVVRLEEVAYLAIGAAARGVVAAVTGGAGRTGVGVGGGGGGGAVLCHCGLWVVAV